MRMILAVVSIVASLAGLATPLPAEIPDRLYKVDVPNGKPFWVSESELQAEITAKAERLGSELAALESVADRDRLEDLLDQYVRIGGLSGKGAKFELAASGSIESCEPWNLSYHHDPGAKNIAELAALSVAVLSVRVVDSKPGIRYGIPGELIEIEILEVLKDAPDLPTDGFYIFDYYSRMVFDGQPICLGEKRVEIGEYVFFIERPWHSQNQRLFSSLSPLPTIKLDFNALVAADGTTHGTLFNDYRGDSPEELARQLEGLGKILAEKP